MLKVLVYL